MHSLILEAKKGKAQKFSTIQVVLMIENQIKSHEYSANNGSLTFNLVLCYHHQKKNAATYGAPYIKIPQTPPQRPQFYVIPR